LEDYTAIFKVFLGMLGVAGIPYLIFKFKSGNRLNQKQKSGKNSFNIQVGKDFKVKDSKNHEQT
jgi:hypothetical protein